MSAFRAPAGRPVARTQLPGPTEDERKAADLEGWEAAAKHLARRMMPIADVLKPHQREGVGFLWNQVARKGGGAVLSHEMGLGKTCQVLVFLEAYIRQGAAETQAKAPMCCVVVPKSVVENWKAEVRKWINLGRLPVYEFTTASADTDEARGNVLSAWDRTGGLLIASYSRISTDLRAMAEEVAPAKEKVPKRGQYTELFPTDAAGAIRQASRLTREQRPAQPARMAGVKRGRRETQPTPLEQARREVHAAGNCANTAIDLDGENDDESPSPPTTVSRSANSSPAPKFKANLSTYLQKVRTILFEGTQVLVLDEAQAVKNDKSLTSRAFSMFSTIRRVACTGTPLLNSYTELFNLIDFAVPGRFKQKDVKQSMSRLEHTIADEASEWDRMIGEHVAEATVRAISGLMHRRTMAVLENILPPLSIHIVNVRLTPRQEVLLENLIKYYRSRRGQMETSFFTYRAMCNRIFMHPAAIASASTPRSVMRHDEDAARMRESVLKWVPGGSQYFSDYAAANPESEAFAGYTPEWGQMSAKMAALGRIVKEARQRQEAVLVFSAYKQHLESAMSFLQDTGCCATAGMLTGDCSQEKRAELCADLQDGRIDVLFITFGAGGVGLTLTKASRVVVLEPHYTWGDIAQAIYRCYRIGQTRPVFAYVLAAHGTVEDKLLQMAFRKDWMATRLVDNTVRARDQIKRTQQHQAESMVYEAPASTACGVDDACVRLDPLLGALRARADGGAADAPAVVVNVTSYDEIMLRDEALKRKMERLGHDSELIGKFGPDKDTSANSVVIRGSPTPTSAVQPQGSTGRTQVFDFIPQVKQSTRTPAYVLERQRVHNITAAARWERVQQQPPPAANSGQGQGQDLSNLTPAQQRFVQQELERSKQSADMYDGSAATQPAVSAATGVSSAPARELPVRRTVAQEAVEKNTRAMGDLFKEGEQVVGAMRGSVDELKQVVDTIQRALRGSTSRTTSETIVKALLYYEPTRFGAWWKRIEQPEMKKKVVYLVVLSALLAGTGVFRDRLARGVIHHAHVAAVHRDVVEGGGEFAIWERELEADMPQMYAVLHLPFHPGVLPPAYEVAIRHPYLEVFTDEARGYRGDYVCDPEGLQVRFAEDLAHWESVPMWLKCLTAYAIDLPDRTSFYRSIFIWGLQTMLYHKLRPDNPARQADFLAVRRLARGLGKDVSHVQQASQELVDIVLSAIFAMN